MTSSKLYRKKQTNYSSNVVRSSQPSASNNKPIQYQKGWVEFYKLRFKVNKDVLIPRPETELLVDYVVDFVNSLSRENENTSIRVIDIGTGAGNIAISIAKNLPSTRLPSTRGVKIIGTDVSKKALKIAQQNANLHGVKERIEFIESNLLSTFCHSEQSEESLTNVSPRYAGDPSLITQDDNVIIVTNLPYIPSARIPYLDCSVKDFEPHVALDGGDDGFELYRKLFEQLKEKNIKFYLLVGEIDYTHGELALFEAQNFFPNSKSEVKLDLFHRQRILIIKN